MFLSVAGIVTSLQIRRNKKGEPFAIAKLEDRSGSIECMIFPKTYDKVGKFVKLDGVYQFTGFSRTREEEVNFIVDNARPLDFSDSGNLTIRIKVTESQWNAGKETFLNILSKHLAPNNETPDSLIVSVKDQNNKVWEEQLDVPIRRSTALIQRIQELFGSRCIGRWKVLRDTEA